MVTIIVEGKTDEDFILDFIEKQFPNILRDKFNIKIFDGKDNIFKLNHDFYDEIEEEVKKGKIEKILILIDADDPKDNCPIRGYENSEKELQELIDNLDFNIEIDYYIFSDESKNNGYLETFLLSVLDTEQKDCIKAFRGCFKYNLSDKFVFNTFYKQKQYPFDYSHQNFGELKGKLRDLFDGI